MTNIEKIALAINKIQNVNCDECDDCDFLNYCPYHIDVNQMIYEKVDKESSSNEIIKFI